MSDSTVRGLVHFIDETRSYGQSGFRKRLVVLEQGNEKFTNYIPVEFIRDNCDLVDELKLGDEVEIEYRLSGRKWQRDPSSEVKYFLNAEASSFRVIGTQAKSPEQSKSPEQAKSSEQAGNMDAVNRQLAEAASDEEPPF